MSRCRVASRPPKMMYEPVVLDLRGNVVGIVVAVYPVASGVQAGSRAVIITAPVVAYALKQAVSALGQ